MYTFSELTIIHLVGLDNFHSVVWDAAALYLLRQRPTFEFTLFPVLCHYIEEIPIGRTLLTSRPASLEKQK